VVKQTTELKQIQKQIQSQNIQMSPESLFFNTLWSNFSFCLQLCTG